MTSEPADTTSGARSGTQAIDRAVALLHAVAQAPQGAATASSLARACGLNKATAWRLLSSLESHGLVERQPGSGAYGIGFSVFELASTVRLDGLIAVTHPVLQSLSERSGETANLAVYRAPTLRYVNEVRPPSVVSATWSGRASSLHATSTGKALLAWLPGDEMRALVEGRLTPHTSRTLVSPSDLDADLAGVRDRGYATCLGEYEAGLNGVSTALLDAQDRPVVVVSVWGTESRVPAARLDELGAVVRESATQISERRPALHAAPQAGV